MDKNKRRCLYGVEKKINCIQPIENTINLVKENPPVKKNKNGQIINLKIEEQCIEDHSIDERVDPKLKSADKSIEEEKTIEKSKEKSIEDVKVEIPNLIFQAKTKQRYENINLIYIFFFMYAFDLYCNNKKFLSV